MYSNDHLVSNSPNSDNVVGVSGVEGQTIRGPGQRDGSGVGGLSRGESKIGSVLVQFGNQRLGLEIPDLDGRLGGSAQPVSRGRETESIDDISGLKAVELLSVVEIPESGGTVLASRSAERTIRGNSDGVDVSSVSNQVSDQLAVGKIPDLDELVPSSGDDDGGSSVGESDTRDPLGVSLILDGVLALSEGVPQLDGLISRSRDNLSVVSREGNREDILSVSDESSSGGSGVQVPQSEGGIPRSRKGELSIRRDDDILNKVSVSSEGSSGSSVVLVGFSGDVPDHDSLISGSRKDDIGVIVRNGDASNPSIVSSKDSSQNDLGSH